MENLKCKCGKEMSCGMKTFDWDKMMVTMSYNCYECGEKATVQCEMGIPTIRFESDKKEGKELVCYYAVGSDFVVGELYKVKDTKERESRTLYGVTDENGDEWFVPLNGYLYKFELI